MCIGEPSFAIASGIPLPDVNKKTKILQGCKTNQNFRLLGEYIVSLVLSIPTMKISGLQGTFGANELPSGTLLVKVFRVGCRY